MSNSLRPNELQHTRLPCPSLFPGVCSNSGPLNQWCHPTISSSLAPFFCSQSFKRGLLLMNLCLPHSPVLPPSGISADLISSNKKRHLFRRSYTGGLSSGELLKHRDSDSVGLGLAQEFAFLSSSHSLMVWSPHFENHRLSCPIVAKEIKEEFDPWQLQSQRHPKQVVNASKGILELWELLGLKGATSREAGALRHLWNDCLIFMSFHMSSIAVENIFHHCSKHFTCSNSINSHKSVK